MTEQKMMLVRKMRRGIQFGVIPFTVQSDGAIRVLLLTSRATRRWVVPKGWPKRRLKPYEAAAQEAFEEAGLSGTIISKRPIGEYSYSKEIAPFVSVPCVVKVFLFQIDAQAQEWPERHERTIQWFDPRTASTLVHEPELSAVLLKLPALVQRRRKSLSKNKPSVRDISEGLRKLPALSDEPR
jgi:8-oxo-dGTP pyrophosphatase MutT (NUDIX family)